jgi:histone arginine demethylase JMJD6
MRTCLQVVLPKEPGLERESVSWFAHIWPRSQQPGWPTHRPLNGVQGPGEVIFVPAGWWHAVLNLDLTVAVTHNFCSSANFDDVWRHTKRGRPKLAVKWLASLHKVGQCYCSGVCA